MVELEEPHVITGLIFGSTVIIPLKVLLQLGSVFEFAVIKYVAVWFVVVLFIKVWLIVVWFVCADPPTIAPDNVGVAHVYVVPLGIINRVPVWTGVMLNAVFVHMLFRESGILGTGLTFMITLNVEPTQVPDFGVTRCSTGWIVFVVLINFCVYDFIVLSSVAEFDSFVTLVLSVCFQVYVVPKGTIFVLKFFGSMLNSMSVHMDEVESFIWGFGFTVISK